ncbi:ribosome silencing factor [Temperatibacter marinus]|uniref:Ribosomal silencing factor RsfS n=1 Tax=Temperatibacter marinus TaxID=1456591 RepID=A0AA52H990_9PROT|nr:ribosome silencing factor [Temperatibacter marinus]WND01445.1 ribosome silencing factor [Temperatibacter marinus]
MQTASQTDTVSTAPVAQIALSDLLETITSTLDSNKAEEIVPINLSGKSGIADYMVIASGRSNRQVAALTDYLMKALKEAGITGARVEGLDQADWVLVDTGDIIVHLFRPEVREFYNLDKLWASDTDEEEAQPLN